MYCSLAVYDNAPTVSSVMIRRLCAGLQTASEQLPVVGDPKLQADVHMLLTACQAAGAVAWALPLSLLLEDIASLAGYFKTCTLHYTHTLIFDFVLFATPAAACLLLTLGPYPPGCASASRLFHASYPACLHMPKL